ncbi:hypothetical protein FPOAC2_05108 [Fusarium poae]|uniref:hypothetical protein n=1 Tax=Fusarium poae TaxID=36050 RepID=UPI001CE85499|nr:hypothetical protein FPOAC1_005008 [Fusarium poae]KAG8671750.1 hypothetical protein FPOAC1_005008 [Fusarium poae]
MASGLFSDFSPWHIPAVFIATAFTFGGLLPFVSPARAIREYGLPERVANSQHAHTAFAIYGSRVTAYGILLWLCYLRRQYEMVDTLLSFLLLWGVADLYVCLKAGAPGTAAWRFASSVLLGGWGYVGSTAKGSL